MDTVPSDSTLPGQTDYSHIENLLKASIASSIVHPVAPASDKTTSCTPLVMSCQKVIPVALQAETLAENNTLPHLPFI